MWSLLLPAATQGRTEVRWPLGQEKCLASPCWNLRSFRSKCTVLKKVLATLFRLFGATQWFGWGAFCPPCYTPAASVWSLVCALAVRALWSQRWQSLTIDALCNIRTEFRRIIQMMDRVIANFSVRVATVMKCQGAWIEYASWTTELFSQNGGVRGKNVPYTKLRPPCL